MWRDEIIALIPCAGLEPGLGKKMRKIEIWRRCKGDGGWPSCAVEDDGAVRFGTRNLANNGSKTTSFHPILQHCMLTPCPWNQKNK